MKKFLLALALTTISLLMLQWGSDVHAASPSLSLSYSFVGCSGDQATYDLVAQHPMGATFTWSHGVNPISGPFESPNYATITTVKLFQRVSVNAISKASNENATVYVYNPCLDNNPPF